MSGAALESAARRCAGAPELRSRSPPPQHGGASGVRWCGSGRWWAWPQAARPVLRVDGPLYTLLQVQRPIDTQKSRGIGRADPARRRTGGDDGTDEVPAP